MFTFINAAGQTLFVRDDAERAEWTQEEMSLECEFPFRPDAVIETGQRIIFQDPSTGDVQVYEVKQAKNREPDYYQRITAESIAISELSDEHITQNMELDNKTPQEALAAVLTGTLWAVGNVQVTAKSSGDITRGSVWQAILTIKSNWNCYVSPRTTVDSSGQITRYLDIVSPSGTWNGLRLSLNKNVTDPTITIDDSEVATALYGYGGVIVAEEQGEENKEVTFADVAWSKTADHPAKPKGQLWIEDPDATAKYGRNGRKRWGFYQNTQIKDPDVLLQKTWEALKASRYPSVMFEGTVADLKRMGYVDVPIRLYDLALVEVLSMGFTKQIQVIKIITDLLNPDNTFLTIGDYVPNIVYISRETREDIAGPTGGGGGKNKAKEPARSEFETEINVSNRMIQLRAYQNDLNNLDSEVKLQEAHITVLANKIIQEVIDRRNEDQILSGKITVEAGKITQIVSAVGKNGKVTSASIVSSINGSSSSIKLSADHIDIDGLVTKLQSIYITSLGISADIADFNTMTFGTSTTGGSHTVSWKTANIKHATNFSTQRAFCYGSSSGVSGVVTGYIALDYETTTIHYMGY
jgi:phage minor structural protein